MTWVGIVVAILMLVGLVGSAVPVLPGTPLIVAGALVYAVATDFTPIGIGRLVLSYPGFPADVLAGRPLKRNLLCRTFSDCTTGPRMGMVSGCYPLDTFYESRPEAERIRTVRVGARTRA